MAEDVRALAAEVLRRRGMPFVDAAKALARAVLSSPAVESAPAAICGVVCNCGPNGEPLACGYAPHANGPHSWAALPTFGGGK